MERKYCIYKYTNQINGKIYIGQTCKSLSERAGVNGYGYKKCTLFWRAIQKYGWDNFKSEILLDNLSQNEANQKEQEMIQHYHSAEKQYGYNLSLGGNSVYPNEVVGQLISTKLKLYYSDISNRRYGEANPMYGKKMSEETRRKLSEMRKGKSFSQEHKDNLRKAIAHINLGRHASEETRKKLSIINAGVNNSFYGKHHTEETKQQLRQSQPCKKILFLSLDNQIIDVYDSMRVAAKMQNISRTKIKDRCENGYKVGDPYYIFYYDLYNNKNA